MEKDSEDDDNEEENCGEDGEIDYVECGGFHIFLVMKDGVIFVAGLNDDG